MPKLTQILKQVKRYPLNEYSDKVVKSLIDKWQVEDPKATEAIITQLIKKFEQIKNNLAAKADKVAIPERFKNNKQLYLDITQYSFDELVKLIKSLPKDEEKTKKEIIAYFVEKERLEKPIVQSYVNRFLQNKRDLKYKVEHGDETNHFSKEDVRALIPNHLLRNDLYLDITNWRSFVELEQMMDALFPREIQAGEEGENTASTNADKLYDQDNLEIYRGDAQHKCVSYNPTENGKKKYGWCITQPGNSNYDYYRFQQGTNRMFYFVFDRTKPDSDPWHAIVIHVGEDNKQYWVTNARNNGDHNVKKWDDVIKYVPSDLGKKLSGLEKIFKYIPPSKAEISSAALRGKKLSGRDFIELDADTKVQYIQSNAGTSPNGLSPEILVVLDNQLKNLAINYGQSFTWNQLKNTEALAKRYAVFRFRHTNYGKDPIPLPFVKYLDEEAKDKYYKTFEADYLNFNQIEQFFGEQITKRYVEDQLKDLGYLPKEAEKYIDNPKTKELFNIYSTVFTNWLVNQSSTSVEDEAKASRQSVRPILLTQHQWSKLPPNVQKSLVDLTEKLNGQEKYAAFLYGMPYILKNGNEPLLILPTTEEGDEFVITDMAGNVRSNKKYNDVELNHNQSTNPFVIDKIYPFQSAKVSGNPITLIKEAYYDNWDKYSMQRKAGILK